LISRQVPVSLYARDISVFRKDAIIVTMIPVLVVVTGLLAALIGPRLIKPSDGGGPLPEKKDPALRHQAMIVNDRLLYETDLRVLDREYRDSGVHAVIRELRERALAGDTKAFHRLLDLFTVSDGYVSEDLSETLASLFKTDPEFVLRNAHGRDAASRDLLFKAVIYVNYAGLIFEKSYPPAWDEITALGKYSQRFVRMYDYYLENFEHLEDWSVTPPE
jgi:hypothetical protein